MAWRRFRSARLIQWRGYEFDRRVTRTVFKGFIGVATHPFRLLPVNHRFFKVLAGPAFPRAIVDKSVFNDFRENVLKAA